MVVEALEHAAGLDHEDELGVRLELEVFDRVGDRVGLVQLEMVIVWYEFNDEPILATIWTILASTLWRFRLPPAGM